MSEFTEILNFLEKEEQKLKKVEDSKPKGQKNPHPTTTDNKIIEPKISKSIKPGFDIDLFQNVMRSELINDFERVKKYKSTMISVTDLISCPRKIFYERKNYKFDLNQKFRFSYLYLIRNVGNAVHKSIQKLYKFDECEKTVISEKFNIKGRIDGIIGNSVIELKTVSEEFHGTYDKKHFHQGIIYSYILNNEYKYNINNISIVYIFRELKSIEVHNLEPDFKMAKSFMDKSLMITDCLSKNILPSFENIPEDECQWCPYTQYCKKPEKPVSKFLL